MHRHIDLHYNGAMEQMRIDNWPRAFEGVRFDVRCGELPKRDGGVQRREVVQTRDSVVILPMLDERTVVMIRNYRFAVGQTLWELPAGTLEQGEDPIRCAGRELIEETGYRADHLQRLLAFYPTPGICTEFMTCYRATGLTHVGQQLDETEQIEVHPLPLEEAYAMIRDGRIKDAKTIAGLLFEKGMGMRH